MSKNYYGSICLTDLITEAKNLHPSFQKGNNGKLYVNVNVWINDQEDRFGNNAAIKISDKDETKGIYIGNLKEGKQSSNVTQSDVQELDGDLPF